MSDAMIAGGARVVFRVSRMFGPCWGPQTQRIRPNASEIIRRKESMRLPGPELLFFCTAPFPTLYLANEEPRRRAATYIELCACHDLVCACLKCLALGGLCRFII